MRAGRVVLLTAGLLAFGGHASVGVVTAADEWPALMEPINLDKLSAEAREALREARSNDYAHVDFRVAGDQQKAIAAYERYGALAPQDDPSLILDALCRPCYLYANTYIPEKGEKRDVAKATASCRRALQFAEEHGIVSVEVTDLRKLYMSTTGGDRLERVRRIAENWKWHWSLTPEQIDRNRARCDKYGRYIGDNPGLRHPSPEAFKRTFSKVIESLRTRCLEKLDETVTYAKRIEVFREIERNFTEADLGPVLWKKLQDRKANVMEADLTAAGIDPWSPDSIPDLAEARRHTAAQRPAVGDVAEAEPARTENRGDSQKPRQERLYTGTIVGASVLALLVAALGTVAVIRRRSHKKALADSSK